MINAQKELERRRRLAGVSLAWSTPVDAGWIAELERSSESAPPIEKRAKTVTVYPDIALGMLKQEKAATGRVWLLLRYLDRDGRGWLTVEQTRALLTRKESDLRVCGWRQLRNLLREGQGIFWHRDKERIWLYSAANVAVALDVTQLTGRPVALPVSVLLAGMGAVRAHFYASFHSGRKSKNPISRGTLEEISGVIPPVQRYYEKATGVTKQRNLAVGEPYTEQDIQARAWHHGSAVFDFIDHHGRQGPEKRHYVAWWLPNSYQGCHERAPKGRMKKVNRQIDLVNEQARGNGLRTRLFHPDGSTAARAHRRSQAGLDMYWFNERGRRKPYKLWYTFFVEGGN